MVISLKTFILKNKYGKLLARHIILTFRKFSPSQLAYKLILSSDIQESAIKTYLYNLFLKNDGCSKRIIARIASTTRNRTLLLAIAKTYRIQKKHDAAFNIFFRLILSEKNEVRLTSLITKALQVERNIDNKQLMTLFESKKFPFPEKATHLLACEYSLHSDNITPNWPVVSNLLKKDFDYTLANFFMLSALGYQKIKFVDDVRDILISRKHESHESRFERSATIIATSYYRSGETEKLQQLDRTFSFNSLNWKLYMSFGHGRILEAMQYRGKAIKSTFLRFYPYKQALTSKQVLTPEKDICGEAFNVLRSLFRRHRKVYCYL